MNIDLYQHTLPIVGTETLITGITLLVLCFAKIPGRVYNKSGLQFFALAMLAMSAINFGEYFFNIRGATEAESLVLLIFAASVELCLFLFAYLSMFHNEFVTAKRVIIEVGLIMLFTTPALCIQSERYPVLFNLFFCLSLSFYITKLAYNVYIYNRYLNRMASKIENYSSDGSDSLLRWINSTFYIVLAVGVLSVVVPLTNYMVLTLYNVFLFFAYLYIYIQIIRNIYVFDAHIVAMNCNEHNRIVDPNTEVTLDLAFDPANNEPYVFLTMHQAAFDKWLAHLYYAVPGITIDTIASQFGTNRTKLSIYLKNEKQTNFYEWIAQLRIEDAKRQLIKFPNKNVCEIAINVGIDDRSNFGRLFKRLVGVSPACYRTDYNSKTKPSPIK